MAGNVGHKTIYNGFSNRLPTQTRALIAGVELQILLPSFNLEYRCEQAFELFSSTENRIHHEGKLTRLHVN